MTSKIAVQIRITHELNNTILKYIKENDFPSKTAFMIHAVDFYLKFGEKLEKMSLDFEVIKEWIERLKGT